MLDILKYKHLCHQGTVTIGSVVYIGYYVPYVLFNITDSIKFVIHLSTRINI